MIALKALSEARESGRDNDIDRDKGRDLELIIDRRFLKRLF